MIIIIKKGKYISCGIDALILKGLKQNMNMEVQLQNKHLNYIILDGLDIVKKYEDENNQYHKYVYQFGIHYLLMKIQGKYLNSNPELE